MQNDHYSGPWTVAAPQGHFVQGLSRVGVSVHSEYRLTDRELTRLTKAIDFVTQLINEQRKVTVTITDLGRLETGQPILGTCTIGYANIELSPRLFVSYPIDYKEFMPVLHRPEVSVLIYVITHEFGHARDYRRSGMVSWELGRTPKISGDGREDYAEAFTEYFLSRGMTTDAATLWYADRYWRK